MLGNLMLALEYNSTTVPVVLYLAVLAKQQQPFANMKSSSSTSFWYKSEISTVGRKIKKEGRKRVDGVFAKRDGSLNKKTRSAHATDQTSIYM